MIVKRNLTTKQLKFIFYKEAVDYFEMLNKIFVVDKNNKTYFKLICLYFAKDKNFEIEFKGFLNKGLMIFGGVGTGKSSSFDIVQKLSRKYNLKKLWFPIISSHRVVTEYNESKNRDAIISYYSKGKIHFDDLGAEREASNYGKEDIFSRIMELRYEEFIAKGTITHITTNLTIEQIKKRYGIRVYDRFFEMFNFIELSGVSRRF